MSTYECILTSSSWVLPPVGGWTVALFIPLPSTQFSSLSFGNLSHLKLFGHEKPNRFITPLQPCLALLQRERQGGTGDAKFFDTKQYGAYTEHRKWAKSIEQPTFTKGVNWYSSIAASCWVLWFNMFGNIVSLYSWRPWQSGIVSGSQVPWACEGNNILSAQITPSTTRGLTFALTTVVNISAIWTVVVSSETLSDGEKKFICAQFDNRNPS